MPAVTVPARPASRWNLPLWVAQVFLAAMFAIAGFLKISQSPEAMAAMGWHWALSMPPAFIVTLGVLELLGAIGIILPALTRILPLLTPAAAAGMVLTQLGAIALHASRGETAETIWFNLLLLAAALFVLWGRTRKAPISPR